MFKDVGQIDKETENLPVVTSIYKPFQYQAILKSSISKFENSSLGHRQLSQ